MRQDDLLEHVEREPFRQFRLHLSSGAFFDIRQPELVDVGRSALPIGFQLEDNHQRFVQIALIHIAWVEVLLLAP